MDLSLTCRDAGQSALKVTTSPVQTLAFEPETSSGLQKMCLLSNSSFAAAVVFFPLCAGEEGWACCLQSLGRDA